MAWRTKMTWVLLSVMAVAGCSTMLSYEQIMQKGAAVNVSDGVSQQEAVLVAQKFLIENGLDTRCDVYRVGEVRKEQDGAAWLVNFNGGVARGASSTRRFGFTQPVVIRVNIADGKAGILN